MSSAILYLAIVGIWAGVLIPRWLKRDGSQASAPPEELTGSQPADAEHDAHADGADEDMANSDAGDEAGPVRADTVRADTVRADTVRADTVRAGAGQTGADISETDGGGPANQDNTRGQRLDRQTAPEGARDRRETRARMLAARRRMLLILCTLTVAALGVAVTRLAAWWVAAPPAVMLAGYLRLLREARRADAEHALLEAAAYRDEQRRRYARTQARSAARAAARSSAPPPAEPASARVIDISGRVRDELYDQYADGERRAVGD